MIEDDTKVDIELFLELCPRVWGAYFLLKEDGTPVAKFHEDRIGGETFSYFCHGLAVRGTFRVWRDGEVVAERGPNCQLETGWFERSDLGGIPVNPRTVICSRKGD